MELKKIVPLHTINMVCSGTKEAEFFNSFLKNDLSPEMIWKKKNSPTTLHKYGMQ